MATTLLPNGDLLRFALLGGLLGLDVVSFPQAMLSRPIVAATAAGALGGNAESGLLLGAVLELFALETLPVGASRYPEWGSASVVGGAIASMAPIGDAGVVCLAVLVALATAWVGGESMVFLRRLNGQLVRAQQYLISGGSARSIHSLQLAGAGFDYLRGFALTVVALGLGYPAVTRAITMWAETPRLSRAVPVGLAAAVAGAAVWKLFHAVPHARWLFAGGLGLGIALVYLR